MSGLIQIGSFILSHLWIVLLVLGMALVAAFFFFGRSLFDMIKAVFDFLRSPVGYPIVILLVLFLAVSWGYQMAEEKCEATQLKQQLADERAARAQEKKDMESAAKIAAEDVERAAFDRGVNNGYDKAISQMPRVTGPCLDRDAADRLFNIK
jgi:hypothetical protein